MPLLADPTAPTSSVCLANSSGAGIRPSSSASLQKASSKSLCCSQRISHCGLYRHPNAETLRHLAPAYILCSTSGGKPEVLAKLFGGQGTINVPSWSPDSKKVAFVSYQLRMA